MPPNPADLGPGTAAREQAARIHDAIERDVESLFKAIAVKVQKFGGPLRRDEIEERAVEVLDETVRRALDFSEKLDSGRPVYPWLIGIALNVLLEQGRGAVRQRRQVPESVLGEKAWSRMLDRLVYEPCDEAIADRIDLREAMGQLDARSRAVLDHRYLRGLEGDELAEAIGAPTAGAARVRVFRALQCLRAVLGPPNPEVTP
jgi:DNA-directed RNA polymerase specialized sigma24 family protein